MLVVHKNFLIIFFLFFSFVFGKLTVQVEPKSSECFGFDAGAGDRVKIIYYVVRGGLLDIELKITGVNGEEIFKGLQYESSQYEFVAQQGGSYEICWGNEMARWTPKIVQFEILVGNEIDTRNKPQKDLLTPGHLTPVEKSVAKISQDLDSIDETQKYLRVREQMHRDTAESTNSRVLWYSILESIVLVTISFVQVYVLRNFFNISKRPV